MLKMQKVSERAKFLLDIKMVPDEKQAYLVEIIKSIKVALNKDRQFWQGSYLGCRQIRAPLL